MLRIRWGINPLATIGAGVTFAPTCDFLPERTTFAHPAQCRWYPIVLAIAALVLLPLSVLLCRWQTIDQQISVTPVANPDAAPAGQHPDAWCSALASA